jgi:putative ABC transport system permease protein
VRRLSAFLRALFRRDGLERDLDAELDSFVDLLQAENERAGLDAVEARRRAILELGGKESVKENVRDRRVGEPVQVFLRDFGFAIRLLVKSPGFAALVVCTLSLGVGVTTAVFSVAHGLLIRSLPYPEPERLVYLWTRTKDGREPFSPPDYVELREQSAAFVELAAVQGDGLLTLTVDGRPEPVRVRDVTPNFLAAYGLEPYLGRGFRPEDDTPVAFEDWGDPDAELPAGVVLISYELFRDRFGADPGVLGKMIRLDLHPYEIVGVTPPAFRALIPEDGDYRVSADVWSLSRMDFARMPRDVSFLRTVGRLREGVTLESARAEVSLFAERQRNLYPIHRDRSYSIEVVPLQASIGAAYDRTLWTLLGAVALVLLIACANLASLLLSRSATRQKELAVRMALGAGRGRLAKQMLTESLLHSLLGAVGGLLVCRFLIAVLARLAPPSLPRVEELGIHLAVLGFSFAAAFAASILAGLFPMLRFSRARNVAALNQAGRGSTELEPRRWDGLLVVTEVALAVILFVGTALLVRSLVSLLQVQPGFEPQRLLTAEMSLSSRRYPRYPRADARVRFARRVTESISSLNGVESVGLALVVPLSGQDAGHSYATEDIASRTPPFPPARYRPITPGYLEAVGTRLRSGRDLDWSDLEQEKLVTLVDEKLARTAWPGEEAVGKRLRIEVWSTRNGPIALEPLWTEVIGVVENVRSSGLDRHDAETVYVPYNLYAVSELALLVRSAADPAELTGEIRESMAGIDPDLAVFNFRVMDEWIADSLAARRFSMTLLGAFSVSGLSLALVGIYGVLASAVSLRRRELGVRLALGAAPSAILKMVIWRGAMLIGIGLALGLVGSSLLSRFLSSQLFGIGPLDALVYSGVALLTLAVGLGACFGPAYQAARIDPMKTLRLE